MAVELHEVTATAGEHLVQFYDDDAQLARTVGDYLTRAVRERAGTVVIATEAHRRLFVAELEAAATDVAACVHDGTLVLLDAADTLAAFVDHGQVDPEAFRRVVGPVVRRAGANGRAVYAYGEMVALLWEAGDVLAAIELEKAWNQLAEELPFALLCAYRSESVQGDQHSEALREVCHLHTSVSADFLHDAQAPGSARRFVAELLERSGHPAALVDDAKLVVSELATNAVTHARSPFTIEVRPREALLRLSVRDGSRTTPRLRHHDTFALSGRGLQIVDTLAARWGVEVADDGKTVWAELRF